MNSMSTNLKNLGLNPKEEISVLLNNTDYPEYYNPIDDFKNGVIERDKFIDNLIQKGFLQNNISNFKVLEIGGGVCYTGAAFASRCNSVVSFELEKVHCLYAKRCKEHFNISNLYVYMGSIADVGNSTRYSVNDNSFDLAVSYSGMFRFTILDALEKINKALKPNGKFICIYPRFWTNSTELDTIDKKLLSKALDKNEDWNEFENKLKEKLKTLNFAVEHEGILENNKTMIIGGDVVIGSNIASSWEEYSSNPIDGLAFGKTPITCNTLVCRKL